MNNYFCNSWIIQKRRYFNTPKYTVYSSIGTVRNKCIYYTTCLIAECRRCLRPYSCKVSSWDFCGSISNSFYSCKINGCPPGVIGVTIDIFADMFPANLCGAGIAATIRHPINILMVYRRSGIDNCYSFVMVKVWLAETSNFSSLAKFHKLD